MCLETIRNKFMGKRVKLKDKTGEIHHGVLQHLGPNEFFPSWGIQATLSRTPIQHVDVTTIEEIILPEPIVSKKND